MTIFVVRTLNLDDLTDIYSMDEDTVFNLATYLASTREPEKMRQFFKDLSPRVLVVQQAMNVYRESISNFDKIVKGEMQ